jgi:hypothetical protein
MTQDAGDQQHQPIQAWAIPKLDDPAPDHKPFALLGDPALIAETIRIKAALEMSPEGENRQTLLLHFAAAMLEIGFRKLPDPFEDE